MSIQRAYDEWSISYDADENLTRDLDRHVTREALSGLQFDSILEIGCGTGKNTAFLAEIGRAVLAVDFSEGMIRKARQNVQADNVRFARMDITKQWEAADGIFDLIACNLVLEHIEDLDFVFSEAARTLRDRGQFFINELHPFKQYGGTKARYEAQEGLNEIPAFVHHVSDFISAAAKNGLQLAALNEHWHEADRGRPPRLISFGFQNSKKVVGRAGKRRT